MIKKRKTPLRICTGCRQKKPKKELIRVVRTPEGSVAIDTGGKMPGRGAYICPQQACLKNAVRGKRLDKNLQVTVSEELVSILTEMLEKESEVEGS